MLFLCFRSERRSRKARETLGGKSCDMCANSTSARRRYQASAICSEMPASAMGEKPFLRDRSSTRPARLSTRREPPDGQPQAMVQGNSAQRSPMTRMLQRAQAAHDAGTTSTEHVLLLSTLRVKLTWSSSRMLRVREAGTTTRSASPGRVFGSRPECRASGCGAAARRVDAGRGGAESLTKVERRRAAPPVRSGGTTILQCGR